MKVSVVTAVLNSGNILERAIESIHAQRGVEIEHVVIDGGSTGETRDVLNEYRSRFAVFVSEPDGGIAAAFNKGIALATGDVVAILSADDFLLDDSLATVAQVFERDPKVDVVYGDALFEDPLTGDRVVVHPDRDLKTVWRRQPLKHVSMFVRRSAYDRFGTFDPTLRFAMDYELVLRMRVRGANFRYLPRPLAAFRGEGVSQARFTSTVREVRDVSVALGYPRWRANFWFVLKVLRLTLKSRLKGRLRVVLSRIYRRLSPRFGKRTL
jgi:glycosyltransferase involved in cell wall biosynthesis